MVNTIHSLKDFNTHRNASNKRPGHLLFISDF